MQSQLSWRLRCKKTSLDSREVDVLQVHVLVRSLLLWKGPMTVKLAFMPLDIASITARITRIKNNSSLNRAARAHYYLINIDHRICLPLVLPQQKDNRLRLERFLIMVRTDIPFLLSATMHYYWKSCCKNSISTQKV